MPSIDGNELRPGYAAMYQDTGLTQGRMLVTLAHGRTAATLRGPVQIENESHLMGPLLVGTGTPAVVDHKTVTNRGRSV